MQTLRKLPMQVPTTKARDAKSQSPGRVLAIELGAVGKEVSG